MTSLKRPAHDTSPKYGGIPSKMPTLVRQRSPVAAKSFLSPPSVDPEPYYLVKDSPGWSYGKNVHKSIWVLCAQHFNIFNNIVFDSDV